MLAGALAGAGYYMGAALWGARDANPKGFFEDREINLINEDLLARMLSRRLGGRLSRFVRSQPGPLQRWLAVVSLETSFPPPDPPIEHRIAQQVRRAPFCFKDPRFCYTLPYWRPFLDEETVFVCVFREPGRSVESILKECATAPYLSGLSITSQRAYDVWTTMYRHVVEKHSVTGYWMFVHFDQVLDRSVFDALEESLSTKIDRTFADPDLKRSPDRTDVPLHAQQTYRRLCELAAFPSTTTAKGG